MRKVVGAFDATLPQSPGDEDPESCPVTDDTGRVTLTATPDVRYVRGAADIQAPAPAPSTQCPTEVTMRSIRHITGTIVLAAALATPVAAIGGFTSGLTAGGTHDEVADGAPDRALEDYVAPQGALEDY